MYGYGWCNRLGFGIGNAMVLKGMELDHYYYICMNNSCSFLSLNDIGIWPTWALLESCKESIKVLVAIRHKENVQAVAWALNRRRSVVPTVPCDNAGVDAVTISDLHEVITTSMVKLQTQHHEPVSNSNGTVSVRQMNFMLLRLLFRTFYYSITRPCHRDSFMDVMVTSSKLI